MLYKVLDETKPCVNFFLPRFEHYGSVDSVPVVYFRPKPLPWVQIVFDLQNMRKSSMAAMMCVVDLAFGGSRVVDVMMESRDFVVLLLFQ